VNTPFIQRRVAVFTAITTTFSRYLEVFFATNIGFSVTLGRIRHTRTRYITYPPKSLVNMLQIDYFCNVGYRKKCPILHLVEKKQPFVEKIFSLENNVILL
jgi:hypothetical protein